MDGKLDPSVPFETETNNQIKTKGPPKLLNRQPTECHRNFFPRISVCRKQARYEVVHHLHLVSGINNQTIDDNNRHHGRIAALQPCFVARRLFLSPPP